MNNGARGQAAALDLPPPPAEALAISRQLSLEIAEQIHNAGPISCARFWQLALYHPQLGYYHNSLAKFGADGDFVTAPELGPGFARCFGSWSAPLLARMSGPDILELGAGSGVFAADLLAHLETLGQLPRRYRILELSGALKSRQQDTLAQRVPHLLSLVHWLDEAPQEPWQGLIIGNEVVDALPPERVVFETTENNNVNPGTADEHGYWRTLKVGLENGQQPAASAPSSDPAIKPVELRWVDGDKVDIELPASARQPGYTTEYQPMLSAWVGEISRQLTQGAVALVDYGYTASEYYHPQRRTGTAIAHYRHRAHDHLLWMPGLQDLSVSVNFSSLALALHAAGMEVSGFTTQAQFLLHNGLTEYAGDLGAAPSPETLARLQEIKQLTLPAEMGERFQVIVASRQLDLPALPVSHLHRL